MHIYTPHIYTCACFLSSNLIDLSSPLTCAHWNVGRQDRLAVGVLWRALGDGARACCARRVARGGRQGTHTHACALGHVLYEGCVCDYEEHEDVDYLCVCMQINILILYKLIHVYEYVYRFKFMFYIYICTYRYIFRTTLYIGTTLYIQVQCIMYTLYIYIYVVIYAYIYIGSKFY